MKKMIRRQEGVTSFGEFLLGFFYQATACGRSHFFSNTHIQADHFPIKNEIVAPSLCLPVFSTVL